MNENETYLLQTAIDYDMPLHEVERIYKLYPNRFYEELEVFVKGRKQNARHRHAGPVRKATNS